MQDIDFDEIDRAVSSITDPKTNTETKVEEPISSGLETPSYVAHTSIDMPTQPETVPSPDTSTSSPAVRRSSGRFMDVVHPSSDMRPAHQSIPLEPHFRREQVAERSEVAQRPEPTPASSAAFHWPDPIDLVVPTPEPVVETAVPNFTPELFPEEDDAALTVPSVPTGPLESPFLSDAIVEKRPLGAFSGADADLPLIEDPIPGFSGVTQQPEAPTSTEEPQASKEVAPELDDEVLLLEAHNEDEAETVKLEASTIDSIESLSVPTIPDAPVGPTSITQQYTEQPSTASQPSGSIYDTEAYHQPLTKPVKKRPVGLIIVWIVGLILVGGGIGAAIYFFVLPLLG
jgi:hypothetical protein